MNKYACCVVLGVWLALGTEATLAQSLAPNARCMVCHGNEEIVRIAALRATTVAPLLGVTPRDDFSGLYVAPQVYDSSVHRQTLCMACHPDCDTLPHAHAQPARCNACHEREQTEYEGSVHGQAVAHGDSAAARCRDCHGSHDILSSRNPQSRTYKMQLPVTCAKCHANPGVMAAGHVRQPHAAEQYVDSMHGRALTEKGLIVAPSCNDCHGVHSILPATDPRSSVYRDNVPKTCGKCHIGVEQLYDKSVHGKLLEAGDPRGPVCVTCHSAHQITIPGDNAFKQLADERCGRCHADRLERYQETFHGKAMALGFPNVAACYDCHGHHDIVPIRDPASRLSPQNKLHTCRQCHSQATVGFTQYIAHADYTDRRDYPALYWAFVFMTTIVLGTFVFFGVHTVLWFVRSAVLYVRDPAAFRRAKTQVLKDDEVLVRFRPFERFLHILVVVSFLLLVATGMPLKFYYMGWAKWLMHWLGGVEVARALHRVGAMITFVYFGLHLASLARGFLRHRGEFRNPKTGRFSVRQYLRFAFGPDMPLPNRDDLRDWWAHQKWFFGRGPQPEFDRWTYWEKFDYFAVFWGVAIIGLSGLVMWFPEQITRVLPGWMINLALIVHSDEALLAAGFIFTFHFFNVHFRLEKFPMDPVIFSGRMTRAEMLHERRRWYDRLVATGQLEKLRLRDEWSEWKRVMHPLGFLAFGLGTFLLVLIFYAMASRLLGH